MQDGKTVSDDFSTCPLCGERESGFKELGGDIVKCNICGAEMNRSEILWEFIEYD